MRFIQDFFSSLPPSIKYSIERGLNDITLSSKGDLDILIKKSDFPVIIKTAHSAGFLISTSITYGGARIFLGDESGNIKRVDFDWLIHYRGIPLNTVQGYLETKYKDPESGLFVLPEKQHANIIHLIKNTYGGAEKYRQLLERNNYRVFNKRQRNWFILTAFLRRPVSTILGKIRYFTCYLLRMFNPTGLSVSGLSSAQLKSNATIMYLFQNRLSSNRGIRAFIDTCFLSKLCIAPNAYSADISLNFDTKPKNSAAKIVQYLRSSRTHISALLFALA